MAEDEEADCSNGMQLLRLGISKNFEKITKSVSKDEFLEIFTFLESHPSKAMKLHKIMTKELYDGMMSDFEEILKEGSLQDALNKINKLSEESKTSANEDAWRPPGNVALHMRSLDADVMKKAIEDLEKKVNEMERNNETLMEKVVEGRSRIRVMNDNIKKNLDRAPIILQRLEKTYDQLTTSFKTIGS